MWQPMETCPENRPVFVKIGIQVFERTRKGKNLYLEGHIVGTLGDYYGWHPFLEWRTDKAPRTGEWLQVTWHTGVRRDKVRWDKDRDEFVHLSGAGCNESWSAWTYDLHDFVPPPKPAEPLDDLAGKSVDEIVGEIKRLTDHLAAALRAE